MPAVPFDELCADVASHFAKPADIVRDPGLAHEQKVKLLRQWDYDLQLLLTATEENMPGSENTAEKVRDVHKALAELGESSESQAPQSSKVGSTA